MEMMGRCLMTCWAIAFCCLMVYGGPLSHGNGDAPCRLAIPSADNSWGANRVAGDSWDPLFKLELTQKGKGEYTVSMKVGSQVIPFSDAVITAEANGSCGVGELHYDSDDFYQVKQDSQDCPLLLTTNRKSVMQQLPPLRWRAPKCGCVHFRAMVIEMSKIYYAERVGVVDGPLAATICTEHPSNHPRKLSREERTELLCRVTERFSGLEVLQRSEFMKRHALSLPYMDKSAMELALSTRRSDITGCCQKNGEERTTCFADIRRHRVDNFCDDGSPDVPFTSFRSKFMREREEACCWRLGEARYDCFSTNAGTKHGQWSADFSLDESDPLNDLGDYPDEILALEKEYNMKLFRSDDNYGHLPPTSSPTTTTTTTTTTPTPFPPWMLAQIDRNPPGKGFAAASPVHTGKFQTAREVNQGSERSVERPVPTQAVVEDAFLGGEVDEEQSSRSIDKTFSKLQRRMWKLSLRTQCCEAGVRAASSAYGDFTAVWKQCTHSGDKMLASKPVKHGGKICSSQFQKCCMEMAISGPSEVVTWQPDTAPSSEWDPDRHLVNKAYLPPHARTQRTHPFPTRTSSRGLHRVIAQPSNQPPRYQRPVSRRTFVDEDEIDLEPRSKRQRASGEVRTSYTRTQLQRRRPSYVANVDEPEIDENPPSRRQRGSGGRSGRRGGSSRRHLGRARSRRRDLEDDDIEEEPTLKKSSERRARVSSQPRRDHRSKSDSRLLRTFVDEPEIDEEPTPKRSQRGRSKEADHNERSRMQSGLEDTQDDAGQVEKRMTEEQREKMRRHQAEQRQLKKLLREIEEDLENDEDEDDDVGDEADGDAGSEESLDTLGIETTDDDDREEEDDDKNDFTEDEDITEDTDGDDTNNDEADKTTDVDGNDRKPTDKYEDTKRKKQGLETEKQREGDEKEKDLLTRTQATKPAQTTPNADKSTDTPTHQDAQEAIVAPTPSGVHRKATPEVAPPVQDVSRRRHSRPRSKSRNLSEELSEDGHSGGRSRRRKHRNSRRRSRPTYRHGRYHLRHRHNRRRVLDLEVEED